VQSHLFQRRADNERSVLRRCYLRREVSKLRREERRVCPRVDLNIAVSRLDAERLQEIAGPIPTAVVENGVDVDYFHPVESDTRRELVFAGSLGTYPNRDAVTFLLSEIWPALQAAAPDYRVTVVGPDPTPTMLAAARDPRVAVTGVVPDVRPYMARAAVYVCPMRVGGGTRLKVLDALAMEKPLVATALAVEGLDLIEERHYLRAETAAEFVAQIRRLEGDAQLRRALGRAGRALARRYSWDVIGERLRRAYAGASRGRGLTRARPMASDSRI
jgi:glycosyltransferase involved in cell wall biosynthesis